jgi:hypothetical protein
MIQGGRRSIDRPTATTRRVSGPSPLARRVIVGMPLRLRALLLPLLTACLAAGSAGCVATSATDDEDPAQSAEAVSVPVFVRSDQLSFGRAPANTSDLSKHVDPDFATPDEDAAYAIKWIEAHPKNEHPVYLGCIHAWLYDTSHAYRASIHTLASKIHAATHHPILFYFEEENASHAPHPVSAAHGQALRTLTTSAKLLLATYANGHQSHAEVTATVAKWKSHYHAGLGIPMKAMLVDVDTSQTPSGFYYGSRGDLAQFNHVIKWTLRAAFDQGFGGFHTFGNMGGNYGTLRAADSTYDALDAGWEALVAAHPQQDFSGL